jgi:hypothetical protein
MSSSPLKKPEGISWSAASVELPPIPMLPAGEDAMSATISAVLPTLAAPLAANVATLAAKENMFSGKVGVAQAAYANSDDAGSQTVGQVVGMLGKLGEQAGKMGEMAGAPAQAAGQGSGMFGSLMQSAMQGAQGSGGGGGQSSPGQGTGGGAGMAASPAGPVGQQPTRDEGAFDAHGEPNAETREDRPDERDDPTREERESLLRGDDRTLASGPDGGSPGAGPVPVAPPEQPRHTGDEDLGRRL